MGPVYYLGVLIVSAKVTQLVSLTHHVGYSWLTYLKHKKKKLYTIIPRSSRSNNTQNEVHCANAPSLIMFLLSFSRVRPSAILRIPHLSGEAERLLQQWRRLPR